METSRDKRKDIPGGGRACPEAQRTGQQAAGEVLLCSAQSNGLEAWEIPAGLGLSSNVIY